MSAEKKYIIDNAQLMAEWDWEKNNELGLDPHFLSTGSKVKAWWICEKKHSYDASISNRSLLNRGCPICAGKRIVIGINDLFTTNPELKQEWCYQLNENIEPSQVSKGSHAKVWWECSKCRNRWQAVISNRARGNGCPYCSGRSITPENSLAVLRSDLLKEWNYSRNLNIDPYTIGKSVSKKVWWICKKGHEWQATVNSRRYGVGCPICARDTQTSFSEQVIFFYVKKVFLKAENRAVLNNCEVDIYIPELMLGIEYDGYFWHKNKQIEDSRKSIKLQKSGIRLVRIREQKEKENISINEGNIETTITYTYSENSDALEQVLKILFSFINKKFSTNICLDINIDRDRNDILQQYYSSEKENSLLYNFPELEAEWDFEKNGNIALSFIPQKSSKRFWWKCKFGHEWKSTVYNRTNGYGCPICSGKKVLKGFNDLATAIPELIDQWDQQHNDIQPTEITKNSGKKVWWKCSNGHYYEMRVSDKVSGQGCPYCSGRRVSDTNNLFVNHKELSKEWVTKLNGKSPQNVTCGAKGIWWWKCPKGHIYQDTISHRINGRGCPYCSGHKVLEGYNDLSTTNPVLAQEWDYENNGNLLPSQVTKGSNKKVWWVCKNCGHKWETTITARNRGNGCPNCARKSRKKR